jgi:hypothetical protein
MPPVPEIEMRKRGHLSLNKICERKDQSSNLSSLLGSHLLNRAWSISIQVNEIVPRLAKAPCAAVNEIDTVLGDVPASDVGFALQNHLVVLRLVCDGIGHLLEVTVLCMKRVRTLAKSLIRIMGGPSAV